MLKKQDLVNKFDVLTKQEIKNHNDQILATNLSINKLRLEIEDWEIKLSALEIKSTNDLIKSHTDMENKFQLIVKVIDVLSKSLDKEHNVSLTNNSIILEMLKTKSDNLDVEKKIHIIQEIVEATHKSFNKKLDVAIDSFKGALQELSKIFHEKIGILDVKLFNQSQNENKIKSDLESKLDIVKLEKDSLMKEINILKKDSFITEKKIENIYTLIDRLQKP